MYFINGFFFPEFSQQLAPPFSTASRFLLQLQHLMQLPDDTTSRQAKTFKKDSRATKHLRKKKSIYLMPYLCCQFREYLEQCLHQISQGIRAHQGSHSQVTWLLLSLLSTTYWFQMVWLLQYLLLCTRAHAHASAHTHTHTHTQSL